MSLSVNVEKGRPEQQDDRQGANNGLTVPKEERRVVGFGFVVKDAVAMSVVRGNGGGGCCCCSGQRDESRGASNACFPLPITVRKDAPCRSAGRRTENMLMRGVAERLGDLPFQRKSGTNTNLARKVPRFGLVREESENDLSVNRCCLGVGAWFDRSTTGVMKQSVRLVVTQMTPTTLILATLSFLRVSI